MRTSSREMPMPEKHSRALRSSKTTPSITARIISARPCRSVSPTKPPRASGSGHGVAEPSSQGMKNSPSQATGAVSAAAVISPYDIPKVSFAQVKEAPPV